VSGLFDRVRTDDIFGREAHTRVRQITITTVQKGLLADEEE
jgi:hypothetical protein